MQKDSVFTLKLEPDLHAAFKQAADAAHRPASQVVRELMREFVQRQNNAAEYDAFLATKTARARASIADGKALSGEEVEAGFARRRQEIMDQVAEKP